jgi:hypothetical protein
MLGPAHTHFKDENSTLAAQRRLREEVVRDERSTFGGLRFLRWVIRVDFAIPTRCPLSSSSRTDQFDVANLEQHQQLVVLEGSFDMDLHGGRAGAG